MYICDCTDYSGFTGKVAIGEGGEGENNNTLNKISCWLPATRINGFPSLLQKK